MRVAEGKGVGGCTVVGGVELKGKKSTSRRSSNKKNRLASVETVTSTLVKKK
jgi:hypothetical protein